MGATVNLHTGRPFDYDPLEIALNVKAGYSEQASEISPRTSGLFSFTNDSETFGALVSFSTAERTVSNTGADTGRWYANDTFASCSACSSDQAEDAVNAAWHPRFPRYADKTHEQDRTGLTGSFQFAPTDSTLITFDTLYANVESQRLEPFMQAISLARTGSSGVQETDVAAYTIDADNTLIAATMDGVDVRSEAFVSNWESEYTQFALTLEQDITDQLRVKAMVSQSESVLDNRESTLIYEHYSNGDGRQLVNYAEASSAVSYDFSSMTSPDIDYSFDTTNPANWEVSEFRDRLYDASSDSDTIKIDLEYDLNEVVVLKAGLSQRDYAYEIEGLRADRSFTRADELDGTIDGSACGLSPQVTADMGSVVNAGGQSFFMGDASQFSSYLDSGCWPYAVRTGDTRDVEEKVTGLYLQADFDTDIAGHRLRGNVGVRQVETELSATGINSDQTVTVDHDYDDTLPSLNVAYNLSDDLILRGSYAKVMSRPNLTDLNPGGSVAIFGDPAVSYGNPYIEPFRADNYDLSLEWYFDEGALVSLAYFYKDIESFPTSETSTLSWSDTGLPNSLLGSQVNDLIDADFEVTRRVNGGGAMLDGWELQYQQNFTFIPVEFFQKMGLIANITIVDSEVDETGDKLRGQSDLSYNFTVFYEDDKFSTRLAYSYRDEYITRNDDDFNDVRYRDETANLDFSASYQFNDNLRFTLEGINLTDEPVADYMAPGVDRLWVEQNTGTQWLLGMSYKY